MQTLLSRAFLYLLALLSLKSVQNVVYLKIFDVFGSDRLEFLINISITKTLALAAIHQVVFVWRYVSQVAKRFGALEANWKTPGRRTTKEIVAPQFQPKVRVASQKIAFVN